MTGVQHMVPHPVLFDPPVLDRGRHQHGFHTWDREHVLILYAYGHPRLLGVSHKLEAVRVGNGGGPDSKPGAKPGPMNVVAQPLALVRLFIFEAALGIALNTRLPVFFDTRLQTDAGWVRRACIRGRICQERELTGELAKEPAAGLAGETTDAERKPPHAEDRTTRLTMSIPRGKAVIFFRFRFRLGFTASCMSGECSNFGQPVSTFSPKYTRMAW